MEIELTKKPKKPIVIEGFPGMGLVGAIAAEFLIDHLKAKQIGRFHSKKLPAVVGVHKGNVLEPFAIFYDEKTNIIIIRALALVAGLEHELAENIIELCDKLEAKELISVEGVESAFEGEPKAFFFTTDQKKEKKLASIGLKNIEEAVIFGVTAALMSKKSSSTFIFAETHSQLPDSRAAAKIIQVLDKYLGLDIDYKPLLQKADIFEKGLKNLIIKTLEKEKKEKEKRPVYLG